MNDGGSEREGLHHGEAEALREAGEDEDRRTVEDHREVGIRQLAEGAHPPLGHAGVAGDGGDIHPAPAVGADHEQPEILGHTLGERSDQGLEALARFEGADREQVALG